MKKICIVGIGRMGKGIALTFAYAGYPVVLSDSEERSPEAFDALQRTTMDELGAELQFLHMAEVISAHQADAILGRVHVTARAAAADHLGAADYIFEAVVEILQIKQQVYDWLSRFAPDEAIISSTTSTMSANQLAALVTAPERFVNAHWLNPAYLMPLVEVSPGDRTSPATVASMRALLAGIGKIPVVCKASPGFIVPRIQAVAMNEAARLVEEGVASAEDVDQAVRVGFGIRFATLGLLEFIDWGGGDILYHATRYLGSTLDADRFKVPGIIEKNMAAQRNGLRDGEGFYPWKDRDLEAYRTEKLTEFVRLLQFRGLMPRAPE